jgi:hypothetical protein
MSAADPQADRGHEPDDLAVRQVLVVAAVMLAGLLLVAVAAWWLTMWYGRITPGTTRGAQPVPVAAPQPHLQVDPPQDLAAHRSSKQRLLHEYGWVDQRAGRVRIPIDRAMDLMLQRAPQQRGGS